ncbi:MAG: hypothetical protein ACOYYU_11595 [Chloroflexota bacterium]
MRKLHSLSLVIASIIFVILACGPLTLVPETAAPQAVVPEPSTPLPAPVLPSATPLIAESYPTAEAASISPQQVVGGIDVNVTRAWQEGKQVYAEVCFTLPDASDWTIWKASLKYADQVIQEYGATLVSLQEPGADGQLGLRCDTLEFYVPPDADLATVTVSVEALAAYPPKAEDCAIYMPKIQQALNQRGIAITLECYDANDTTTMQIVSKPETMSQEEAEQIVFSDEFFTITGPWEFTFTLGG